MELNNLRYMVQWFALIVSNIYLGFFKTKQLYQGAFKSVCVPFFNCHTCPGAVFSCPIGTMQHFMTIHKIPFTLLGFLFAVGILVGSMACGWLCPFGLLQDLMYKIKSIKIKIPKQLSMMRYLVLLFFVILIPLVTHQTWFSKLCPMGTLQAALPWVIWNPVIPIYNEPAVAATSIGTLLVIKILVLLVFLVLFVISKRPFCRTICPLGAIFGVFNKYSLLRLKVDRKSCKDCDECSKRCPTDINIGEDENASTCVRCLKCLECENVKMEVVNFMEKLDIRPRRKALKKSV